MGLGCKEAGRRALASVGGHATDAERLELEAHLGRCASCAEEHAILGLFKPLRGLEAGRLSAVARERVRVTMLARRPIVASPSRRLAWPIAGGAMLAFAAAWVLWIGRPGSSADGLARVTEGDVRVGAATGAASATATASASDGLVFTSGAPGVISLGSDVTAALGRTTEVVWRSPRRVLQLRRGVVTVDVSHREGQHFAVKTPRFRVQVIGTRFTVDVDGVRTERGLVRVVPLAGGEAHYVHAGETWHFASPPLTMRPVEAPRQPPEGAPAAASPLVADTSSASVTSRSGPSIATPATTGPTPADGNAHAAAAVSAPRSGAGAALAGGTTWDLSAAARLGRARRALARGDAPGARSVVTPVFGLDRRVAVEARALYAESFLVEGRYTDAVEAFRIVARDFRDTRQAETALYAIAQLESEHGETTRARGALQAYLARYPRGRFVREASERLAALSSGRRAGEP